MTTKITKSASGSNLSTKSISGSPVWPWLVSASAWPTSPGVYWFLNDARQVIYVGKAKNLRNRLRSYTRVDSTQAKTFKLVSSAIEVKYKSLESELEAILVEAELIKSYQPKYNINLRDDKSPLYIIITTERFPRVLTARKKQLLTIYKDTPDKNIFGPFASTYIARSIIKTSRRVFKFCNATSVDKKHHKACFYTHINLCNGACLGKISTESYQDMLTHLRLFLRGKKKVLYRQLKSEMSLYATTKEFEKAAIVRDQISAIDELYAWDKRLDHDPLLPMLEDDIHDYQITRLSTLLHNAGLVPADYMINRIEAYDISNTSGDNSTASMVVFENGKPATDEYRRFKIQYTTGPNDPAMIKEALTRRLDHPEWTLPDLIIIDGGKGQLRKALQVVGKRIPTISLVKRPDRLLVPIQTEVGLTYREYKLEQGKPVANLVAYLRDEAHRFAKKYHSHLRSRAMLNTQYEKTN